MLIRFKVSNFLSFKEETEFTMIAGRERLHPHHVVKGENNQPNLLRAALLYGANAAGKSNFVKALKLFKDKVLNKNSESGSLNTLVTKSFKSDTQLKQTFEIEFISSEKIYNYSFTEYLDTIVGETLFEYTNGKEIILIDRKLNSKNEVVFEETNFLTKKEDKDFLRFVQKSTNPTKLFLTHSKDNNVKWFQDVINWFRDSLQIIFPETSDSNLKERLISNKTFKEYFVSTLQNAGTGITHVEVETIQDGYKKILDGIEKFEKTSFPGNEKNKGELPSEILFGRDFALNFLKEKINSIPPDMKTDSYMNQTVVNFFHGKERFFNDEESDGTQRLFDLAYPFFDLATSETPKVYIIDELERNLHTNLSYMLLKSYLEQEGKGQLIATTHDTHLLDLDLLRKDEIWFAEKNEHGATRLYSLYEFNPRYDKKIEKEYLTGRFGAIPFLGNFEFKKRLAKNGEAKPKKGKAKK